MNDRPPEPPEKDIVCTHDVRWAIARKDPNVCVRCEERAVAMALARSRRTRESPENIAIVCTHGTRLRWERARKDHTCIACGEQAGVDGEEYIRGVCLVLPEGALCRPCAWALYGPDGAISAPADPGRWHACGRGCLLDEDTPDTPEWQAYHERRKAIERALESIDWRDASPEV